MATYPFQNEDRGLEYPMTKMNFVVSVTDLTDATAAFSQVTGLDASVDVIEFRQGNANTLSPVKIPGLVKHGNVTLRMGYTHDSGFKKWIMDCVSEMRSKTPRHDVTIELLDIRPGAPSGALPVPDAVTLPPFSSIRYVAYIALPEVDVAVTVPPSISTFLPAWIEVAPDAVILPPFMKTSCPA